MSRGIYFTDRTIVNNLQYYITHEGYDSCKQPEAIVRAELRAIINKPCVVANKQALLVFLFLLLRSYSVVEIQRNNGS